MGDGVKNLENFADVLCSYMPPLGLLLIMILTDFIITVGSVK